MAPSRSKPFRQRARLRLLWLLVPVVVVLYAIGFVIFAEGLPRKPAKLDHPDGIVALTGGGDRLRTAVSLLERGIGKRLLITGVHSTTTKAELKAIAHGGKRFDCCVDLGFSAADTRGNAAETAAWAKRHHYHRLVIVTASYHMPRSLTDFAAAMPNVKLEPWPVEPDGINLGHWWRDPHTLKLLQSEYLKYLASVALTHVVSEKTGDALDRSIAGSKARSASHGGNS